MNKYTLEDVMEFSRNAHAGQKYGGQDYFDSHVMAVFEEVKLHSPQEYPNVLGYVPVEWCVALLHDVGEDTDKTLDEIGDRFGPDVRDGVWRLTDEEGPNRKTKKMLTYYKIREDYIALLAKLCDRIVNLRECLKNPGSSLGDMYLKEDYTFHCALWRPNQLVSVWEKLDTLVAELEALNGPLSKNRRSR